MGDHEDFPPSAWGVLWGRGEVGLCLEVGNLSGGRQHVSVSVCACEGQGAPHSLSPDYDMRPGQDM